MENVTTIVIPVGLIGTVISVLLVILGACCRRKRTQQERLAPQRISGLNNVDIRSYDDIAERRRKSRYAVVTNHAMEHVTSGDAFRDEDSPTPESDQDTASLLP